MTLCSVSHMKSSGVAILERGGGGGGGGGAELAQPACFSVSHSLGPNMYM